MAQLRAGDVHVHDVLCNMLAYISTEHWMGADVARELDSSWRPPQRSRSSCPEVLHNTSRRVVHLHSMIPFIFYANLTSKLLVVLEYLHIPALFSDVAASAISFLHLHAYV